MLALVCVGTMLSKKERDRFLDFLGKAEGRDKFGKTVQFFTRFLAGFTLDMGYKDTAKNFESFWRAMLDARRMHWFGKSFMEIRTVEQTLDTQSLPVEVRYAHALARFFFACRWAVENVMILYKIGALKGIEWKDLNRVAKRFWTLSVLLGILTEVFKLRRIMQEEEDEKKVKVMRNKCLQTIACHVGDSAVPAVIGWDIPINDTKVGIMHTVSALIQSKNLYPPALK